MPTKTDRDQWLDRMFKDPRLSDTDVAELVKLYKYLQPARAYELGPRLLTTEADHDRSSQAASG